MKLECELGANDVVDMGAANSVGGLKQREDFLGRKALRGDSAGCFPSALTKENEESWLAFWL